MAGFDQFTSNHNMKASPDVHLYIHSAMAAPVLAAADNVAEDLIDSKSRQLEGTRMAISYCSLHGIADVIGRYFPHGYHNKLSFSKLIWTPTNSV